MWRYLRLVDQPIQVGSGTVGGVAREPLRLEVPQQHIARGICAFRGRVSPRSEGRAGDGRRPDPGSDARVEVTTLEIRRAEDIAPAFEAIKAPADALYVVVDGLVAANRTRIITLALGARLPTIFSTRDYVQAGGLMSYGPNFPVLFRRTAELVDKILRGTKPGDIPVEQPTKFDLVLNLTTAKALGLKIPESFLLRADVVIE
jgi:hypothetical protein